MKQFEKKITLAELKAIRKRLQRARKDINRIDREFMRLDRYIDRTGIAGEEKVAGYAKRLGDLLEIVNHERTPF